MRIVEIYAAILTVLFFLLSIRIIRFRRNYKLAFGDGAKSIMIRAIRAHANFTEYTPFCLILLILVATVYPPSYLLHFLGSTLVTGRIIHAYGVSQQNENFVYRVSGMVLTFAVMMISALVLLGDVFLSLFK